MTEPTDGHKARAARDAAALVRARRVAALGTLHDGAPNVTLVPFAWLDDPSAFVVLVSALATHWRDMHADPRVALMIAEPEPSDTGVHALARVSIRATARALHPDAAAYAAARGAYEARFPDMRALFTLGDFTLFLLAPVAVRVVGGFARAASIGVEALSAELRAA